MESQSDIILLNGYCRGDIRSFDILFRRYASKVYATAFRLTRNWQDAEDVLQEVFVTLSEEAQSIRHADSLRYWLYRVTVNKSMSMLRRNPHAPVGESLDDQGTSARAARIVEAESLRRQELQWEEQHERELLREVGMLIPKLPERQAAALVLHGFQGLTHHEVGTVLQCTENAARSNYSLACRRLRELVEATRAQQKSGQNHSGKEERRA